MEAFVLIIFATRAVLKLGNITLTFPSFSWGIITHVTRLDQSCDRKYLMAYKLQILVPTEETHRMINSPNGAIVLGIKSPPLFCISLPTPPPPPSSPCGIYSDRYITALWFS